MSNLVDVGFLTYGNVSLDTLQAGNITIQDDIVHAEDGDRIIQIVDQERRLFYIPSSKCKSFYVIKPLSLSYAYIVDILQELQVAMVHQFMKMGRIDIREYALHFHLQDGQEVTSGKWSAILKQLDLPLLKVTLSPIELYHDDSSSSIATPHSKITDNDKLSLDMSEPGGDTDDNSSEEDTRSNIEAGVFRWQHSKSDDLGFLLIDPEQMSTSKLTTHPERRELES